MKRHSKKTTIHGIDVFLAKVSTPLSYFGWIFIPESQEKNINPLILRHEATHVEKRHGLDLLVTELYAIVFWFNPVIYLYRKTIKAVHEFQADKGALTKNGKGSEYLELMLNAIQIKGNQHSVSYFNNPLIKKRIDMITKTQSRKRTAFIYVLLLGCFAFVSLAFSIGETASIPMPPIEVDKKEPVVDTPPPSIFPVKGYSLNDITSQYGQKVRDRKTKKLIKHRGIDIPAPKGTPVIATADGTVAKANLENEWGNLIVIIHSDGYETWFAHLNGFNVKEKQSVKKGDVIGYVGNTGRSSSPHLHYEVHKGKETVNPMDYIE